MIQRYSFRSTRGETYPYLRFAAADGEWVLYQDYAALERSHAELLELLKENCGRLDDENRCACDRCTALRERTAAAIRRAEEVGK